MKITLLKTESSASGEKKQPCSKYKPWCDRRTEPLDKQTKAKPP